MVHALRFVIPFRKKAAENPSKAVGVLTAAIATHVSSTAVLKAPTLELLGLLPQPTEPAQAATAADDDDGEKKAKLPSKLPENEMFIGLLLLLLLLDNKLTTKVWRVRAGDATRVAYATIHVPQQRRHVPSAGRIVSHGRAPFPPCSTLDPLAVVPSQAVPFSLQLMERVTALKRRTLDPIAERIYFYASWAHE